MRFGMINVKKGELGLTSFLTNDTKPYPLDLSVCGSRMILQSLQVAKADDI